MKKQYFNKQNRKAQKTIKTRRKVKCVSHPDDAGWMDDNNIELNGNRLQHCFSYYGVGLGMRERFMLRT